jgi:hypothetical protein
MSTKLRENQLSCQSNNFCQDARKKHVKTFVTRALPHNNLPLSVLLHLSLPGFQ